jgi:plasmid stabilization system protein ParE
MPANAREQEPPTVTIYGHTPHIYRVIYRVVESRKEVDVLHIRHGARDEFTNKEGNGNPEA